jgi:hypothetical protein
VSFYGISQAEFKYHLAESTVLKQKSLSLKKNFQKSAKIPSINFKKHSKIPETKST